MVLPILPKGRFDSAEPGGDGVPRFAAVAPNGTGPFKVTEFAAGDTVKMQANEAYFPSSPKGTPKLDSMTYRTITDSATQIAELMTGGIDWIWGISNDQAGAVAQAPHITSINAPTMRISYMTFDSQGTSGTDAFTKPDELLPNLIGPLVVVASLEMAHAILLESALSFLRLGVQPPTPSWGLLVSEGKSMIFFDARLIALPGAAIAILVLSINLIGDGVRDILTPEGRA